VFHGGARSVKITGRTAEWNGIGQNVATSNFVNVKSYTVNVWVRSQTGTPTAKATVRLTASSTTYINLASTAINSSGWTLVSGTAPVSWSGTLTGVLFYVETATGTDNIYIDDASLTGSGGGPTNTPTRTNTPVGPTNTPTNTPVSATNFLTNANMESGTTNWVVNGAGTLSSDTSVFHGGARSVKITGRTAAWNGIGQNVATSNFVNGQNRTVSVWVRSQTGTPTGRATLRLTASSTTYVTLASATINSTGWTQLTGTVPVSWSGTLTGVLFYVETVAGTDNIYIDDASLN
jgi:arabinoxylan arabinofuranohydrolase